MAERLARILCIGSVFAMLVSLAVPGRAAACTSPPPKCIPVAVLPEDGATIPADMLELLLNATDDLAFTLTVIESRAEPRVLDGLRVERVNSPWFLQPSVLHVAPQAALESGSVLQLAYRDPCADGSPEVVVSYEVAPAAGRPEQLGTLHAVEHSGEIVVGKQAARGSCIARKVTGYADLSVELSEEAKPYADQLVYELEVDGYHHPRYEQTNYRDGRLIAPWESELGREQDRIFAACNRELEVYEDIPVGRERGFEPYLDPGRHDVRIIGKLPDGTELRTEPVAVDLVCPSSTFAGRAAQEEERASREAASSAKSRKREPAEAGCATMGSARSGGSLELFAVLLGLCGWRLRRARRKC